MSSSEVHAVSSPAIRAEQGVFLTPELLGNHWRSSFGFDRSLVLEVSNFSTRQLINPRDCTTYQLNAD